MTLQQQLKKEINYDPLSGIFTRLISRSNSKKGSILGKPDKHRGNYLRIGVLGQYYAAHHLAVLYMKGHLPKEVDHLDHDPVNNKWNNLREVTHAINGKNQKKYKNNPSSVTGVRQRASGKWRARIYHKGSHIDLGTHTTFEKACKARLDAEHSFNFHSNHGT